LQEQKNIEVRGFGTFKIRHRKTRMARNPRTGSPVEVSARPVPVFKPSKELRAKVANISLEELEHEDEYEETDA
jgi:integration host factor subunit beta